MQCVILAGGLATRVRPLTDSIPKSLIPICGKPFLFHQLKWLEKEGVDSIVLSIAYRADQIIQAAQEFLSKESSKLDIQFVDEGATLMGTAGAIRLALDKQKLEEKFFVLYGDSFLPVNFREIWAAYLQSKQPALMTVFKNENQWDKSNVIFRDSRIELYNKSNALPDMKHIDYGLSAFNAQLIEQEIPKNTKMDLANLLHELSAKKKLAGFEVKQRFFEIGSFEGIKDFEGWVTQNDF